MNKSRGIIIGLVLLGLSVFVGSTAYQFVRFWMSPADATGAAARVVFYEVKPHEQLGSVAHELQKLGVVSNARMFYWYGRLTGKSKYLKAVDYRFTTKMRPDDVMAILMSGIPFGIQMVVPEGFNMAQIAEVLDQLRAGSGQRFLKLCTDAQFVATLGLNLRPLHGTSLEGYLFPDSYLIGRKEPEEEIIRKMVRKYKSVFTPELADRARAIGMSEHQVVTLASIVEKETGAKQERPLIASVFHNRLKKRMRLQSDPTVIYGVKDYAGNITRKHLETSTPYNTYTIPALPPGPIANPGKDAILAVLYPAESEYLYFVSHNDGTHEFTMNYDDHRKAVVKFQIDPKARAGKSWRELQKKAGQ